MGKINSKNKHIWLAVLLLIGVACNLPSISSTPNPAATIEAAVQGTLSALWVPPSGEIPTFVSPPPSGTAVPAPILPLQTSLPAPTMVVPPQAGPGLFNYIIRSGDTLQALSGRFKIEPSMVTASFPLSPQGFLPVGEYITFPYTPPPAPSPPLLIPDSEVIFSPSAAALDVPAYIRSAGGYLSRHREQVETDWLTGAEIITRVSIENSINPALLLAMLEYRSGWVTTNPPDAETNLHPVGFMVPSYAGLYRELLLVSRFLTIGYYGWRAGTLTRLTLADGSSVEIDPTLNSGTVALQSLFAVLTNRAAWNRSLYGPGDFPALYKSMFGDPWQRAALVEPLFPPGIQQPALALPFLPGLRWSLTGGPHAAWGVGSPYGAIDFAPVTGQKGCEISTAWATAVAPGLVVRSANGVVVIDLDGDGSEHTGWNILYLHIARDGRIPVGTQVNIDDRIGHPSCEGGPSTGTHVHISRKYNGEWLGVDSPLPMILSGWQVYSDGKPYLGGLKNGDKIVSAKSDGSSTSSIFR